MAFDRNPKSNPSEVFISGKTAEAIVREAVALLYPSGLPSIEKVEVCAGSLLVALVGRYDRKAASREEAA